MGSAVLLLLLWVAIYSGHRFSELAIGASRSTVIAWFGPPDVSVALPEPLYCQAPGTTHELHYGSAWVASWNVVGLNAQEQITCILHLDSP